MTFGGSLSKGDARCLVKAWLLEGVAIEDPHIARTLHMSARPRDLVLKDEAELDAAAAFHAATGRLP